MVVMWVFTADCSSVPDWLWDVGYNIMRPPQSFLLHHKTASVLSDWEKALTASYISLTLGSAMREGQNSCFDQVQLLATVINTKHAHN